MKKFISLLCICILLFTVCSCGLSTEKPNSNEGDIGNGSSSLGGDSSSEDTSPQLQKYLITYETGLKTGVSITSKTQEVFYGKEFVLYIPEHTDYIFVKWVIKGTNVELKNGVFSYEENITLEAVWKEAGDGDYGFL